MSETTQVNPTTVLSQTIAIDQITKDVTLGKQLGDLYAKKDFIGAAKLLLANKQLIGDEIKEVEELVVEVKSGYKTTEFWLALIYVTINVWFFYKGIPIPTGDDATLGGALVAYIISRHNLKSK